MIALSRGLSRALTEILEKSTFPQKKGSLKYHKLSIFWSNYSDLTRPGPPNGGLVREVPGYFREIQVSEILFHLARIFGGDE